MAEKRKPGRPPKAPLSDPNSERRKIANEVLRYMAEEGLSLRQACLEAGTKLGTFRDWRDSDAKLSAQYAQAREDMYDKIADETMAIADTQPPITSTGGTDSGHVQYQRLRVDTRKWLLSKICPKKYGEKLELSGDKENPLIFSRVERVIVKDGYSYDEEE